MSHVVINDAKINIFELFELFISPFPMVGNVFFFEKVGVSSLEFHDLKNI